jgi:hypothetical protein
LARPEGGERLANKRRKYNLTKKGAYGQISPQEIRDLKRRAFWAKREPISRGDLNSSNLRLFLLNVLKLWLVGTL